MISQNSINKINEILNSFKLKNRLNCNFIVSDESGVRVSESYGFASIDLQQELNEDSIFELASLTKSFVSLAILYLEQNQKLNIKDNVREYIHNFPYENITLENLLSHTSGLPDFRTDESIFNVLSSNSYISNESVLNYLLKFRPNLLFKPKSDWNYSNTGYILLSLIVESIEKSSLQNVLQKLLFYPLQLNNTYIPATHEIVIKKPDAVKYYIADKKKKRIDDVSQLFPFTFKSIGKLYGDCGVYSSIRDFNRFMTELTTNQIIPREMVEKCFTQYELSSGDKCNYGFGWMVFETKKGKVVCHSGSLLGCSNVIYKFLDTDTNMIFLSNFDKSSSYRDILMNEIYKVIMNEN